MANFILLLIFLFIFLILLIRQAIDFFQQPLNQFFDEKLVKRYLWVWLPFYSLKRLIKEVILKKK